MLVMTLKTSGDILRIRCPDGRDMFISLSYARDGKARVGIEADREYVIERVPRGTCAAVDRNLDSSKG